MHEMGVVLNIVRTAERYAKSYNVKKIGTLTLQVGELTGLVPAYVKNCWPVATENTVLDSCEIIIEEVEGIATCEDCGHDYRVVDNLKPQYPICPKCSGDRWKVKTGREVMIKDIGVYDNC